MLMYTLHLCDDWQIINMDATEKSNKIGIVGSDHETLNSNIIEHGSTFAIQEDEVNPKGPKTKLPRKYETYRISKTIILFFLFVCLVGYIYWIALAAVTCITL